MIVEGKKFETRSFPRTHTTDLHTTKKGRHALDDGDALHPLPLFSVVRDYFRTGLPPHPNTSKRQCTTLTAPCGANWPCSAQSTSDGSQSTNEAHSNRSCPRHPIPTHGHWHLPTAFISFLLSHTLASFSCPIALCRDSHHAHDAGHAFK
jgi:hypothetical protein